MITDPSLSCTGNVIVEVNSRKCITHNEATTNLFKLISLMLAGQTARYSFLSLPTYFMLYYNDNIETMSTTGSTDVLTTADMGAPCLKEFIEVNRYVDPNDEISVVFTANIIPSIITNIDSALDSFRLALVAGNQQDILAHTPFSRDLYDVIRSGGQALVQWRMSVMNKTSNSEVQTT